MGVWTASLEGINRVHDIRFDTEWKSRGCSKYMLVRHKQTPSDMFQIYKTLVQSQGDRLCKIESTERKSYLYNWNVLPSACCKWYIRNNIFKQTAFNFNKRIFYQKINTNMRVLQHLIIAMLYFWIKCYTVRYIIRRLSYINKLCTLNFTLIL